MHQLSSTTLVFILKFCKILVLWFKILYIHFDLFKENFLIGQSPSMECFQCLLIAL